MKDFVFIKRLKVQIAIAPRRSCAKHVHVSNLSTDLLIKNDYILMVDKTYEKADFKQLSKQQFCVARKRPQI